MSPDVAAAIQDLVASVPPGTAAVEVEYTKITFQLGGGLKASEIVAAVTPLPEGGEDGSVDPARMTPIQRVRAYLAEHGDEGVKLKTWQSMFAGSGALSGRELARAVDAKLIEHSEKVSGKDSGAFVVSPSSLIEYLEMREQKRVSGDLTDPWRGVLPNTGHKRNYAEAGS